MQTGRNRTGTRKDCKYSNSVLSSPNGGVRVVKNQLDLGLLILSVFEMGVESEDL